LGFALEFSTLYGHEAGAKALQAAHVLVAGALVDGALAAEFGFQRLDRQAVALGAAVAATFADQVIDHDSHGRVDQGAALAAAALFGGAGLVVDDRRRALDGPKFALDAVQLVAVVHLHARWQLRRGILLGLIGDDHLFGDAFCHQAVGDLAHRMALGALADLLTTRHRYGVVVQDLVSDVDAGGDGLADRQQAAVKIGAVAQVGEYMLFGGKRLLADPRHAFAAHLREADGGAVHPHRHEVAADAGHRARSFRHHGGSVVRAARAEPRLAVGLDFEHLHRALLGL